MVFAYLKEKGLLNRALLVVPNTNLVIQGLQDFEEFNNNKLDLKIQQIYGGTKEVIKPDTNIVIGTFQSLSKKQKTYFEPFDVICIDEAHQTNSASIKTILGKCSNAKVRFGLSGTFKEDTTADFLTVQAFIGPMVLKISPNFLFQNKFATPVNIKVVKLNYATDEVKEKLWTIRNKKSEGMDGSTIFNLEKQLVVQNPVRFNYITDFISKVNKNSLVLFINIKDKYGERIYDRLREISPTDKEIYYVDGSTKDDNRELYKKKLEIGNNKILVASFKTFSTGISIKNVHNIFFVESYKSEVTIKQSIGRGMRLHGSKEEVNIVDFVDDFSWNGDQNYLLEHSAERIRIYEENKYKYKVFEVNL